MPVPFRYNVRSVFYRTSTTLLTLSAIALTVCVLCIVLALQQGFSRSAARTGNARNVICLRDGATSEGESSVSLEGAQKIKGLPEIAVKDGRPLACPEVFAGIYMPRENGSGGTNVSVRGTSEEALVLAIRDRVRVVEGSFFKPGRREVVVGRGLVGRIKGCRIGGVVELQNEQWPVVGVIDGGGSSFDSEIWADGELVRALFKRQGWNTVVFRAAPGVDIGKPATFVESESANGIKKAAESFVIPATGLLARLASEEFQLKAMTEPAYFEKQAGFLGAIMGALASLLAFVMAAGAVFGCTNTLLASVAGRTREIGALLAVGFRPADVRIGFLVEALLIGLLGGVLGVVLALPVNGMATGTFSWGSFTEATFAFEITPFAAGVSMAVAAAIGVLGGVLPAFRAARLKPVDALRD